MSETARSEVIKLTAPDRYCWEVPILYEDEYILALNKPSNLLVAPDQSQRPNLMRMIQEAVVKGRPWVKARNITYLMNVHRLDLETSGVLLLGKSKEVVSALTKLFESREMKKEYVALVHGRVESDKFEVAVKLEPHPKRYGLWRVGKRGKPSHTEFVVEERFIGYTLVRCFPTTGRSHQIRVHLQYLGHPIVGDADYGGAPLYLSRIKPDYKRKKGEEERPLMGSLALHAEKLEFVHPMTGNLVLIVAPWPKHLQVPVKYLRRYAKV